MADINELWQEAKTQLSDTLPKKTIPLLEKIRLSDIQGDKALVSAESEFIVLSIKSEKEAIANVLSEKYGSNLVVDFVVDQTIAKDRKEETSQSNPGEAPKAAKTVRPQKTLKAENATLNPKYTLQNFIQGDNSEIAYRAAQVIALNPGTTNFNPCLIYGGVGLGKTHLLQAIGNFIYENHPEMNIIYVTAENFTNEFIEFLGQKDSTNPFKKKYRNADVLLIDDIHFLQKKIGVQEELFHTFVELYLNNKQIVFTCDRPITELTDITDRLKSRFSSGLNVDLRPPEYETRVAIARRKCKDMNISLPDDVIDFICQTVKTNVRDLEGALITVSGVAKIINKPATIEMAKSQLKNFIVETIVSSYSINDVFTATANYFNVSLVDMKGSSRSKAIQTPRQIAIYISYKYGHFTQSDIGNYLKKDHTSIRYSFAQIDSQIDNDEGLKKTIENINRILNESSK